MSTHPKVTPGIQYGYSGLPPDHISDSEFINGLASKGYQAFEVAFTQGFPWNENRCVQFGQAAAAQGIRLSVHAPYSAVLTVPKESRAEQCRADIARSVELAAALGASPVVIHLGSRHNERWPTLYERIKRHLGWVKSQVGGLGVDIGVENTGRLFHMGSKVDLAVISEAFTFVRPVIDWAHVHAINQGSMLSSNDFAMILRFLQDRFPYSKLSPLHTHFSDVEFNLKGEIRHLPYGEGTLRVRPLVQAAASAGINMTVISESRDDRSHNAIYQEITDTF